MASARCTICGATTAADDEYNRALRRRTHQKNPSGLRPLVIRHLVNCPEQHTRDSEKVVEMSKPRTSKKTSKTHPQLDDEHRSRIRLWVAALRSDQFTQIRGQLADRGSGRCCLGVACELSGVGQWVNGTTTFDVDCMAYEVDSDQERYVLHYEVAYWLFGEDYLDVIGWEYSAGPKIGGVPLATLNDGSNTPPHGQAPLTFSEIADRIEREWLT